MRTCHATRSNGASHSRQNFLAAFDNQSEIVEFNVDSIRYNSHFSSEFFNCKKRIRSKINELMRSVYLDSFLARGYVRCVCGP